MHANASTNRSCCLSYSMVALDFFLAKSTMVRMFVILDIQTLGIFPYPPLSLNLGTPNTCATSGTHTTLPPMCCYMAAFKACVYLGTGLLLLWEKHDTKSCTFCNFHGIFDPLVSIPHLLAFLYTHSKEWMMFHVFILICWSNHLPSFQKLWSWLLYNSEEARALVISQFKSI
jgi:hypothetical protein